MGKENAKKFELMDSHIIHGLEILNNDHTKNIHRVALDEYQKWTEPQKSTILNQYCLFRNRPRIKRESPSPILIDSNNLNTKVRGVVFLPTMGEDKSLPNFSSGVNSIIEASRNDFPIMFGIIIDKSDKNVTSFLGNISKILFKANIPFFVLANVANVGYVASIKSAMKFFKSNKDFTNDMLAGFIDDDAFLTDKKHYSMLAKLLDEDPSLYAVSGLAVDYIQKGAINSLHNFFNIPNAFNIVDKAKKHRLSLSRPHIHGGGGGCLMKATDLENSIDIAEFNQIMLGPAISALSGILSKHSLASDDLPVIHETKNTFYLWLMMVLKYYRTWEMVDSYYGQNCTSYVNEFKPRADEIFENILDPQIYKQYLILKKFRSHFKSPLW